MTRRIENERRGWFFCWVVVGLACMAVTVCRYYGR